jgi:hypothetical protein
MSVNGITNVYTIWHCDGCPYMLPIDSNDYDSLTFDGRPRASSWNPIRMGPPMWLDGQPQQPCDFPNGSVGSYLITNKVAKEKIGPHLNKYGEFLPLRSEEGQFWAFHVTHFVDALNEHASDVLRSPDEPKVVLMIHKHVFRPEKLTADWMFKLPQSRGRGRFYVTDPFVNLISASGLTGLEFKRVWPHS